VGKVWVDGRVEMDGW
jgi:hypothetical protein